MAAETHRPVLSMQGIAVSLLAFLALIVPARSWAQHSEAEVKAAFIFSIARYAEWSPDTLPDGAPLSLCVLGPGESQRALVDALGGLRGKQLRGHVLEVRAGQRFAPMKPCHITIMLSGASEQRSVLQDERDTLTISDGDDFIEKGGMVGLVMVDNRVQIEVNLESTRRGRIQLSAQLLKLARKVKGVS